MGSNTASTGKTVTVRLEAAEIEWEIAPGQVVPGYGFNGQVPGPVIEADVGDTLVVELTNALPEPTSIHRDLASPDRKPPRIRTSQPISDNPAGRGH